MYCVYYIQYLFTLSITHSGIILKFVTNYLQVIVYKYVESNLKKLEVEWQNVWANIFCKRHWEFKNTLFTKKKKKINIFNEKLRVYELL